MKEIDIKKLLKQLPKALEAHPEIKGELYAILSKEYVTREEFYALMKELRELRIDMNTRFEAIQRQMDERFEAMQRQFIQLVKRTDRLDRRIQKGLTRLGARIGIGFERVSRRFVREILEARGIKVARVKGYSEFDHACKVFEKPAPVEVDIFVEEPLVVGEVKSFIEDTDTLYLFDKKAKFLEVRFGKTAQLKIIVCMNLAADKEEELFEVAEHLGIVLVEGE
jgi:hypothetical protein